MYYALTQPAREYLDLKTGVWHEADPIGELAKLWELWQPQMEAYVTRALNPASAPSYGVPGDR